jgi:hypothetical protein
MLLVLTIRQTFSHAKITAAFSRLEKCLFLKKRKIDPSLRLKSNLTEIIKLSQMIIAAIDDYVAGMIIIINANHKLVQSHELAWDGVKLFELQLEELYPFECQAARLLLLLTSLRLLIHKSN